jgi:osmotically-inducible protein OsmY
VKAKIEEALRRTVAMNARGVGVEVTADQVILTGSVRNWLEKQEAERAAWAAPGVRHVDDRISIEP